MFAIGLLVIVIQLNMESPSKGILPVGYMVGTVQDLHFFDSCSEHYMNST